MPRLNSFCNSGLHDVSKCTAPRVLSSDCPSAGCASEIKTAPVKAVLNILIMGMLPVQDAQSCDQRPSAFYGNQAFSRGPLRQVHIPGMTNHSATCPSLTLTLSYP